MTTSKGRKRSRRRTGGYTEKGEILSPWPLDRDYFDTRLRQRADFPVFLSQDGEFNRRLFHSHYYRHHRDYQTFYHVLQLYCLHYRVGTATQRRLEIPTHSPITRHPQLQKKRHRQLKLDETRNPHISSTLRANHALTGQHIVSQNTDITRELS